MQEAYAGIDVAFAKKKRLPVAVVVRSGAGLEPLSLRCAHATPPAGRGNVGILRDDIIGEFAEETAVYLKSVESEFGVRVARVAIDAPSAPKAVGLMRRQCESALDERKISCITTPSFAEFATIRHRGLDHMGSGGAESRIPGANQLWMLVGFELFRRLRRDWECLEVYPQAIATILGARDIHKSHRDGVHQQLAAAARHTGWPVVHEIASLDRICYGSYHDRLDAWLSAWVASLVEGDRRAIGCPPDDVIWVPRLEQ
jgi:hypothetical protein